MTKKSKDNCPREFDPSIDLDIGNLPKPWTEKQAKFVFAYLADPKRNATNAAIKAGFSEKAAKSIASRMMTYANFSHIQDYINFREQKTLNKWAYDHEQFIGQIVKQSTFNIFDFYTVDEDTGELKIDWRKVPREMGTLISAVSTKQLSIKTVEGGEEISLPVLDTFVKFTDKEKSQEMLNKIMQNYKSAGDSEDRPLMVKFINDIPST